MLATLYCSVRRGRLGINRSEVSLKSCENVGISLSECDNQFLAHLVSPDPGAVVVMRSGTGMVPPLVSI